MEQKKSTKPKKYFPKGVIPTLAKRLGLSKPGVYARIRRKDAFTINMLELCLLEHLEQTKARRKDITTKIENLRNLKTQQTQL